MLPKLLIVDDDEEISTQMKWALAQDYSVLLAQDRASAINLFNEHQPFVVLLDLGLPPNPASPDEGLATLAQLVGRDRQVKVIIISGQSEKANALRAIGEGAYDFVPKPVDASELKIILKRTFHVAFLEKDFRTLQDQLQGDAFEGMVGTSQAMQQVFTSIRKVAATEAPVLILGESGTGKEMAALAIYRRSSRKEGPFVAINCGAIPETLLESELFGHEKGAFTGAHATRKGHIETANGGTLFLDEIGELPSQLQVKLLRFLQEQRIQRLGGRAEIQVNVRIIAATNVDLKKAIAENRFREDLFYRLAVVRINLPPLRERESDVWLLAKDFLRKNAVSNGKDGLAFGHEALKVLNEHNWPGNVRELENRVKRAVIMAEGKRIVPADLELESLSENYRSGTLKDAREALERDMVVRALRKHNGKIAPAATDLGISRPTMYELMEKLGISKPEKPDTSTVRKLEQT